MIARSEMTDAKVTEHPCAHCGEPCPAGAPAGANGERFCCSGCRTVWGLIRGCGLGDYYRLRDAEGAVGTPAREMPRRRLELDSASFLEAQSEAVDDRRRRVVLGLDGLRCGACLWLIESLPRLRPGVISARVDAGRSAIEIDWDPHLIELSAIAELLSRLGYEVLPLRDRRERLDQRRADRAWLIRLGTSAVISANTMGIAFALYGGSFHGMDPATRAYLQWISLGLAAVSVFVPGRILLRNAWFALRSRVPHVDLPISLALVAALAGGAWSTWRGGDGVYAESLSMLVMLLLAGRFVQFRSQKRAREQVELIAALLPGAARRLKLDGTVEMVPLEALHAGDIVVVPAGEVVPADGSLRVPAGTSRVWADLQALTGESRPVELADGDRCWAGTRLLQGPVEVAVEAAGAESRMGRIRAMVEEASSHRAPVVEYANRIAGWFLLAVVVLAIATFVLWVPHDPAAALEHTVALLVVTCPCALGLATPLAIVASLAKAARVGMLIKGGDVLERLSGRGTLVVDKTGTLTEGRMRVECVEGSTEALMLAASLERLSAHPIAAAIVEWSLDSPARAARHEPPVTHEREVPGSGMLGRVGDARVVIGRLDFVYADWTVSSRDAERWRKVARSIAQRGWTPVAVAVNGEVVAVAGVGDPLRPDAEPVMRELERRGWRVVIASGDDPEIVRGMAQRLSLDESAARGGLSPEQKLELIERLKESGDGPTLMVGDGVNDVAAMAASDVGVALGTGTRASLEVGDVCLARHGLGALPSLLAGAQRTRRVIRLNFGLSLGYNLLGASLAIAGLMNPLLAAIIMPISGLTVTAVAIRATRFAPGGASHSTRTRE
ncbi:MAG: heavy metal translocating P-type ATPase [Phycisphaeraceae bacterium]|nr:heavy metal translocating P-type ATPase [Phycisphaeraceae bacterium]